MIGRRVKRTRKWNEQSLKQAMECVEEGRMNVFQASLYFGIPNSTLRHRLLKSNPREPYEVPNEYFVASSMVDNAIPRCAELILLHHIKQLRKFGFAPDQTIVRNWALQLDKKLNLSDKFNDESEVEYDWICSFLQRHPDLLVREATEISIAAVIGMNRRSLKYYFTLLDNVLTENGLHDKPSNIFNMDEIYVQLHTRPKYVLAARGSKNMLSLTPNKKGETISIIACCNAEGMFLPPYAIFKSETEKDEYLDGMPSGSQIVTTETSLAYVDDTIFKNWLKTHFLPRKPTETALLIVDGRTHHINSLDVLDFCERQNIILFCLPSHASRYLQPLDREFFKSFQNNYFVACKNFQTTNSNNTIHFGKLLSQAWSKSATVANAVTAFNVTGISPFNPDAITSYACTAIEMEEDAAATASYNSI
nr:uncharacterized protein LOC117222019 [Megalopta genalis]